MPIDHLYLSHLRTDINAFSVQPCSDHKYHWKITLPSFFICLGNGATGLLILVGEIHIRNTIRTGISIGMLLKAGI